MLSNYQNAQFLLLLLLLVRHKKSGWQYLGNAQTPVGVKPTGFFRAFQIFWLFDDSTVGILGYCPVTAV